MKMKQFEVFVNYDTGKMDHFFMDAEHENDVYDEIYKDVGYDPGEVVVNEVIKVKPVVHYVGEPNFKVWGWSQEENGDDIIICYLDIVVDHPKLGHCYNVKTSKVIGHIDSNGRFETQNTIYEPVKNN